MIYFDNAATSFPKPESVWRTMENHWFNKGGNPGRSGHRLALEAGRVVMEARDELQELFNAESWEEIIFTLNATDAINMGLLGILQPGDHVVTTSMEHNSVLRPLKKFEKSNGSVSIVSCDKQGLVTKDAVASMIKPETKLVVMSHVSNLTGGIQPIKEVGELCAEKGIIFMVDAAQSAGCLPIDVQDYHISLLAFTGHKSLFGPQGTGGLYVKKGLDLQPWRVGGTGSKSDSQEHPDFMPDKLEAGTLNALGLSGLIAGIKFIKEEGLDKIRAHEMALTDQLVDGLRKIESVKVYGPELGEARSCVVPFNIEGVDGAEVATVLDQAFDILTRPGLHCAPLAHETIGTFPYGAVRASIGYFNNEEHVAQLITAVRKIAQEAQNL